MPMNENIPQRLMLVLILAALFNPAFAADTENRDSTNNQPATQSADPAQASPETDEGAPQEPDAQKTPSGSAAAVEPLEEFKPSDTIQADSAVSFPIDI
jgi:hypothetical protein